jgi:hypothetical protein
VYDTQLVPLRVSATLGQLSAVGGAHELALLSIFGSVVGTDVSRDFLAEGWVGEGAAGVEYSSNDDDCHAKVKPRAKAKPKSKAKPRAAAKPHSAAAKRPPAKRVPAKKRA